MLDAFCGQENPFFCQMIVPKDGLHCKYVAWNAQFHKKQGTIEKKLAIVDVFFV